ncbi:GGDEF domain-containing protein [Actinoplanes auranticolor]|uniref:GGDEF domain-containing protein n=1 Tax=Actinoplanes auranticolor TaxID=47988 RepID=UPI001BB44748|nr:GGDEF domain-containing protein [Actinoplanes auranticolor]
MTRIRQLLPAGNLDRTRLAATALGCLGLAAALAQVGNEYRSPGWHRASFLAIVLVMAAVVLTHLRGRAPWWDAVTLPVLITVGGAGLRDPLATIGLSFAVALGLSLYGPTGLWVLRTVGTFAAIPVAVAISPISLGRVISWHSPTVLGMLPMLALMSAMMRGIYLALRHQERVSARDAVLAQTGSRMISLTEVTAVRRLGVEAANAIVALTPGVAMVILRRDERGLFVKAVAGLPESLLDRTVPESVVTGPAGLEELAPGFRHWRVETFSADLHLLVGGRNPVAEDVVAAFRTVSNQVVLGEAACVSHAELDHRAHHDHLTGLPTRDKFFRELDAATAAGTPGSVALLLIDLDDFKAVNDTYGHAAGDELLVELAGRIVRAGGPGSVAARLGGDEFALLLTGLGGPGDADATARTVSAAIVAPARLTDATVTVGASIGIAAATAGCTAGELTRHADVAMYAAKAHGKNRVERYDPERLQPA